MKVLFILTLAVIAASAEHYPTDEEALLAEEGAGKFEGDIDEDPNSPDLFNAMTNRARRWANGVVPFVIHSEFPSAVRTRILDGINTLNRQTAIGGRACLNIRPRTNERDYILVRRLQGCFSRIGRSGGAQTLSIGRGCERIGTVMHEFLHALGFYHEQSRSDRDNFVTINWSNIRRGTEGNFRKLAVGRIDLLGTNYNYNSVMHYGAYAFAINRRVRTIVPRDSNANIGQRTRLDALDIRRVQIFYECNR
ncbi:unnamed protein product [Owenia fusiformis]|uniref:Metalloendopeptidase n=1 Tax=Owenia fusiformis TaxID=6347 RepID=A0A8J1U919_OWEFU|nr:unnamed protein product [Owenia fusiformis]